jgi:uroporphyrinogen decarboxylase
MDLVTETDNVKRLADRILAYNLELIRQWAVVPEPAYRVDGIYITDDYGLEKSMIMNPKTWRDIFKPRYAQMVQAAHDAGVAVQYHSCGDIWAIIPDLVEIGIDILGPLQSPPLPVKELGREFAGEVTFLGLVDSKALMHQATPQQVTECVIECVETLGTPKGGYIAAPTTTIMPEVPFENIEALVRTAGEYRYPP